MSLPGAPAASGSAPHPLLSLKQKIHRLTVDKPVPRIPKEPESNWADHVAKYGSAGRTQVRNQNGTPGIFLRGNHSAQQK